jgi:hypothetical protein
MLVAQCDIGAANGRRTRLTLPKLASGLVSATFLPSEEVGMAKLRVEPFEDVGDPTILLNTDQDGNPHL